MEAGRAYRDYFRLGSLEAGSNAWAVDSTRSSSGKPLLANDPHLGTHIPSLWYLAHLSAGTFDVIGATLPGVPAVAIGRNASIAWGETNVAADVEDLYLYEAGELYEGERRGADAQGTASARSQGSQCVQSS